MHHKPHLHALQAVFLGFPKFYTNFTPNLKNFKPSIMIGFYHVIVKYTSNTCTNQAYMQRFYMEKDSLHAEQSRWTRISAHLFCVPAAKGSPLELCLSFLRIRGDEVAVVGGEGTAACSHGAVLLSGTPGSVLELDTSIPANQRGEGGEDTFQQR